MKTREKIERHLQLRATIAERINPYFTAIENYKHDPIEAFGAAKLNFIAALKRQIETAEEMTLDEFCVLTGSNINKSLLANNAKRQG